jgi:hypothetical protein
MVKIASKCLWGTKQRWRASDDSVAVEPSYGEEGIYLYLVKVLIKLWKVALIWKIKSNDNCDLKPSTQVTWLTNMKWWRSKFMNDQCGKQMIWRSSSRDHVLYLFLENRCHTIKRDASLNWRQANGAQSYPLWEKLERETSEKNPNRPRLNRKATRSGLLAQWLFQNPG